MWNPLLLSPATLWDRGTAILTMPCFIFLCLIEHNCWASCNHYFGNNGKRVKSRLVFTPKSLMRHILPMNFIPPAARFAERAGAKGRFAARVNLAVPIRWRFHGKPEKAQDVSFQHRCGYSLLATLPMQAENIIV